MKNREIQAAWNYHDGTKHSHESIRRNPHFLDWAIQPMPFKLYPKLEPLTLPQELASSGMTAVEALTAVGAGSDARITPNRQLLAEVLFLSAGVTKRRSYPGGEMLFRAAACTGALYHIDLYLICGELEDLDAGVYHFSPQDFALRRLRAGDHRRFLAEAAGEEPAIAKASCVIASASTFWRNAWKYQARAYRHCYWDNGTILANLLAATAARTIPAKVVLGFVDTAISELLGVENRREAPLSLVALGSAPVQAAGSAPIEPLALETVPLSKREIDYPAMRAMHEASSLQGAAEVAEWRGGRNDENGKRKTEIAKREEESGSGRRLFPLKPPDDHELPRDTVEAVIVRRGSTRQFAREPIAFSQLSLMLDLATRGIPGDCFVPDQPLNDLYLIVHAVEGLPSGAYVYRWRERALELLEEGDFRRQAGDLGLGQEIPADCSVNVYFLADLHDTLARFGNRGYRAAQLEASIMGGKLYLAAYLQRLGASGLTFFDDDVSDFFSPHAAGKSVMFLVALGKSAQKKGLNVV